MGTVDLLLNYFKTNAEIQEKKGRSKSDSEELSRLETTAKEQKRIFHAFHGKFKHKKLITRIVASFEMKAIYQEYCPPLVPQQVLQFLTSNTARKSLTAYLKRLKIYYGKSVSLVARKAA